MPELSVNARRVTQPVLVLGLLALAVLLLLGFATPWIIRETASGTTPARIAVAIAILALMGLLMGMPLAIGMRLANRRGNAPVSFLWGINGATSVCCSVLGIAVALFFGIAVSYWCGWASYVIALVALFSTVSRDQQHDRQKVAEFLEDEAPSEQVALSLD